MKGVFSGTVREKFKHVLVTSSVKQLVTSGTTGRERMNDLQGGGFHQTLILLG